MYTGLEGQGALDLQAYLLPFTLIVTWCLLSSFSFKEKIELFFSIDFNINTVLLFSSLWQI